jgi:uncharacterized protein YukE
MVNIDGASILVQDELANAGPYLNGQAQTIEDELSQLNGQIQPIFESWGGHAAELYNLTQQKWSADALALFGPDGVLGVIAQHLNVVWNNYCDAEYANIQSWQQSS